MIRCRLQRRWLSFCAAVGARGEISAAFQDLDERYGAKGRCYHSWRHVAACLGELRRIRAQAANPLALELAVWFHDAVCEPGAADNEEKSARLAAHWASVLGIAAGVIGPAERLILATQYDRRREGGTVDEDWIRDIDLAVLGGSRCRFRAYERRIRREYSWMPARRFSEGRAALLQGLLEADAIYATACFRRRCERRARRNLTWARKRLLG